MGWRVFPPNSCSLGTSECGLTWDFTGGPVVKTLCFHCSGHRFDPWRGGENKIPHVMWCSRKIKKKKWPYLKIRALQMQRKVAYWIRMGPNSQESDLISDRKGLRDTEKVYMEGIEAELWGHKIVAGSPRRVTGSEEGFFPATYGGSVDGWHPDFRLLVSRMVRRPFCFFMSLRLWSFFLAASGNEYR